jgi:hypothetical protein
VRETRDEGFRGRAAKIRPPGKKAEIYKTSPERPPKWEAMHQTGSMRPIIDA